MEEDDESYVGFGDILLSAVKKMRVKDAFAVFVIFIIVNLSVFIDVFMSRVDGLVIGGQLTNQGTFVQGLLLVLLLCIYRVLEDTVF